jgi:hypothetical protein
MRHGRRNFRPRRSIDETSRQALKGPARTADAPGVARHLSRPNRTVNVMSSDQKAIIALINRGTQLLNELHEQKRANRDLEQRLARAQARIEELEAGAAAGKTGRRSRLAA